MFASMPARWAYWAVAFAATAGFTVCLGPALFGEQRWNLGGLGGFLGAAIGSRLRNRDYWQLDRTGRHEVDQAVRTGEPTGSDVLDPIARHRLVQAVRSRSRGNTIAIAVSAVALLAAPVLASDRTQDWWYLLNLVAPVMLVAIGAAFRKGRANPAQNLARFDERAAGQRDTPQAPRLG